MPRSLVLFAFLALAGCGSATPAADNAVPDASLPDQIATEDAPVEDAPPADLDGGAPDAEPDAGPSPDQPMPPVCGACDDYADPTEAGPVDEPELIEASGLAASAIDPDVIYAHNDSGDSARFFAIDPTGASLGEFVLPGASAADWEDIAVGPCGQDSCVFLGDIGDNPEQRDEYAIYRVVEPTLPQGGGSVDVEFERIPFEYPDGSHNAETLLAHPITGDLYIVTKILNTPARVYRLAADLPAGQRATAELVGEINLDPAQLATGGAINPCGDRLLIRTYGALFEYRLPEGMPFEGIFEVDPVRVPVAAEAQGEAVTYAGDGLGYFTVSEGNNPVLNRVVCR